jgi:hypothetical protein
MRCATHPDIEINLRCGKCDKLICPKCMVQTPVGARCRECARLRRIPTYNITPVQYAKAIAAALVLSIVTGIVWSQLQDWLSFLYLDFILALLIGYAIGELVSMSINKRRGTKLQVVAGLAVVLSYIASRSDLVDGSIKIFVDFNVWSLFALFVGVVVAINRLR